MTQPIQHIEPSPPTRAAANELEGEIASLLIAIEHNYRREGTGLGSRFEGERLEVVQARAVIERIQYRLATS